jgi:diguanylate cyclase (GGDEF)-like protein/PAS domain S-box-containing protein
MAHHIVPHSADATLDAMGDAVLSVDASGAVAYLNAAAEQLTGWSRLAAVGRPVTDVLQLVHLTTRQPVPNPLLVSMARDATVGIPTDSVLIDAAGRDAPIEDSTAPIRDTSGTVTGAVMVFRHMGPVLAQSRHLAHAALHDPLTQLPNRALLVDRLETALALASRRDRALAVCFIDVDDFKDVNDSLGHATGDRLLQSIASRLRAAVRQSDTVSRYGGDEFVVMLTDGAGRANIGGIATNLVNVCGSPHQLAGGDVTVTVSLGVALYPRDGRDAASLIANADAAMYAAKQRGRGRYRLFDITARPASSAEL